MRDLFSGGMYVRTYIHTCWSRLGMSICTHAQKLVSLIQSQFEIHLQFNFVLSFAIGFPLNQQHMLCTLITIHIDTLAHGVALGICVLLV